MGVGAVPLMVSEMIKIVEADGWYLDRVTGSHRQFRHAVKPGTTTIAGKPSDTLPPGTEKSILKQAGIERRQR
jgi:predicted RNA binding protein YcfA (HicA-like mRNA interferase family)